MAVEQVSGSAWAECPNGVESARTTRHPGYAASQKIRKRIEEGFGWLKTVGGLRKTKLIGRAKLSAQLLLGFSVYNLIRLGSLSGWWRGSHV